MSEKVGETEAEDGDFVTILSSELIAEIVEAYFNAELYKKTVKVVNLKPTADGYAFSLAFASQKERNEVVVKVEEEFYSNGKVLTEEVEAAVSEKKVKRSKKGQFVTKEW